MNFSNTMIYAKTAVNEDQLVSRLKTPHDGLEYQLLPSDFLMSDEGVITFSEEENMHRIISEHPASAIHLPMSDCNIEDASARRCLELTFELAEISYESRKASDLDLDGVSDTLIVVHNELHPDHISLHDWDDMISELSRLFEERPDGISIAIENTTPFRFLQKGSTKLSSGYFESPVLIARQLREKFGNKIGNVLDICHASITRYHMDKILFGIEEAKNISLELDDFMLLYSDTLLLVHLAGYEGSGYGKGHATPIDILGERQDDITNREELFEFISLYDHYGLSCPITLEINEKDVMRCDGYETTYHSLQSACSNTMNA